jgi:hypothetical protein
MNTNWKLYNGYFHSMLTEKPVIYNHNWNQSKKAYTVDLPWSWGSSLWSLGVIRREKRNHCEPGKELTRVYHLSLSGFKYLWNLLSHIMSLGIQTPGPQICLWAHVLQVSPRSASTFKEERKCTLERRTNYKRNWFSQWEPGVRERHDSTIP